MEEFPQYEFDIDAGEELFHEPFANGKSMADCFPDYESGVRQNYPHWDRELGEVVTMEWAINRCREEHGEKPLKYYRGPIAQISAYLAYLSRGHVIDVEVPADDPRGRSRPTKTASGSTTPSAGSSTSPARRVT